MAMLYLSQFFIEIQSIHAKFLEHTNLQISHLINANKNQNLSHCTNNLKHYFFNRKATFR